MSMNVPQPVVLPQELPVFVGGHGSPELGGTRAQCVHGRAHVATRGDRLTDVPHGALQYLTVFGDEVWSVNRRQRLRSMHLGQQSTSRYCMDDPMWPGQRACHIDHGESGSDQEQIALAGKTVECADTPGVTDEKRAVTQPTWCP